jgi:hypothetical protein
MAYSCPFLTRLPLLRRRYVVGFRPETVTFGNCTSRVTLTRFSVPLIPNTLGQNDEPDPVCRVCFANIRFAGSRLTFVTM